MAAGFVSFTGSRHDEEGTGFDGNGCALVFSGASYAAGDMAGMDMSGGAKQAAAATPGMSHGEIRSIRLPAS